MRNAMTSFLVPALLWAPFPVNAQKLNPEEQRIVASVDARVDEANQLLERFVNMPSATQNLAGVRQVGDVFQQEFAAPGFTTRWVGMPKEMQRAGHLVAEHPGKQGKRILLLGHLDTVIEGERFRRNGTTAHGTGVNDMKGGDVILLFALKALKALDAAERGAGDISYVAPYVAVLDGLGIMGEGSHALGETADLDSLAPAAQAHGAAALSPVAAELTPPMTECVC